MQVQKLLKYQGGYLWYKICMLSEHLLVTVYSYYDNSQLLAQLLGTFWLDAYHVFPRTIPFFPKNTWKWSWKVSFVDLTQLNNDFK